MQRKLLILLAIALISFAPSLAKGASFEELLRQIAQLQAQIAALQNQLAQLKQSAPESIALTFQKDLRITDRNEEVTQLQKILQKEGLFCKTCGATGYFGYWTKAALMNFQQKYVLPITGIADTTTRTKLNQLAQEGTSAPIPTSPPPSPTAPPITVLVLSPNGGEQLKSGGLHNITWFTNASAVNIELWKGNTFIQHLAIGVEGGKSLFPWAIPLNLSLGNDYKIYVSVMNAGGTSVQFLDSSDAPFSITPSSTSPPPPPPPAADITRPSPSLSINGGQTTTSSTNVTLSLFCTDASGIKDVRYSNDGVFDTEPFEPYALTKSWSLTNGNATKTVFYSCRDNSANQNISVIAQSIILNTTPTPIPTPTPTPTPAPTPTSTPITPTPTPTPTSVPILVLKYFPLQAGTQNLDTAVTGMGDSLASIRLKVDSLTQRGIDKMEIGSTYRGYKDVSAAKSLDYFVLDTKEFLSAMPVSNNQIPWNPNAFRPDYMKMLNDVNICNYVNNRGVKHVWVWGYHFGNIEPAESNMAMGTASQALWNHGTYGDVSNSEQINDMPTCSKTYTLYNYNYGRGLGELLEDHGHQLESVYSFVDNNLWSKFRNPYGEPSPVVNSCGWTHSGPNSKAEYQPGWASEATVKSNCEDWHPDGNGVVKDVSCHTWYGATCLDNGGVEFKVWWMQNIPGKNNNLMDGTKKLRNWWDFYGAFDSAVQQGKNLSS